MKEIKTKKGESILVDDEDYHWLNKYPWHISASGYAKHGFVDKYTKKMRSLLMHRLLMGLNKSDDGLMVDHIDRNKLNNQRSNLRLANASDNSKNMTKRSSYYSSRFIGVSRDIRKWRASVRIGKKNHYLGLYETEEEAARVRDKFVKKLKNPFYRLNFSA